MRLAALYDVHGNLPALEAVLADVERERVDLIVCGGDIVAGPLPAEVFDRLTSLQNVVFVRGNADREVVMRAEAHGAALAAEKLGATRLRQVERWPLTKYIDIEGLGSVLFCHATPRSDEEIITRITPDRVVAEAFMGWNGTALVGHTHVQFERSVGALRLVNAGSVGMPYEGRRGAFWALVGPEVQHRRTTYDVESAAAVVRALGAEEHADWLLRPPDPEEVTEYFETLRGS
ncbi:MAG TPA: metallophosphoesterase family protein [Gaiellaceae bacterium]|nr:metallophosphoesterase family protein [Gaiellaceae bacterium]